ncbi:endoglucanase V-like protein [Lentinula edodes]|uniref:Endoglucanase V-like protein n=1 Tax=Lentinula edodes TaxID=5353 RepID=A0A1Q3E1B7_LENED|nr:endoglucanase V-like protein [Lentinula edodes]
MRSFIILLSIVAAVHGWVQQPSGSTSFTQYSGCGSPACGISASGYTAAINQLAFGSSPGLGAGDACGRCFQLTGTADPYSPSFTGPFKSIVVKVTDMCPAAGNQQWCGQTSSNTLNSFGKEFHFDICEDTGGAGAFFPSGHTALTGTFTEASLRRCGREASVVETKEALYESLHTTTEFLKAALEENESNVVLVHCFQGVSRSATVVCAYLISNVGMTAMEKQLYLYAMRLRDNALLSSTVDAEAMEENTKVVDGTQRTPVSLGISSEYP